MFKKHIFWIGVLFLCFSPGAQSHAGQIEVVNAWVAAAVPNAPTGAAYMLIKNHGSKDDQLITVETDASKLAGFHTMVMKGDMMYMNYVKFIPVPAGGSAELKPGGYHVMIMKLRKHLKEGGEVHLTLKFKNAGEIKVAAPITKGKKMKKGGMK